MIYLEVEEQLFDGYFSFGDFLIFDYSLRFIARIENGWDAALILDKTLKHILGDKVEDFLHLGLDNSKTRCLQI